MKITKKIVTDRLTFSYIITVSREGTFTTILPEKVVNEFKAVGFELGRSLRHRKHGYIISDTMIDLEKKVNSLVEKYNMKELVEEKIVLRYKILTFCSYCKLKTGEIVPSGVWQNKVEGTYDWIEGTVPHNISNSHPYGFQIFVKPYMMSKWVFPDGSEFKDYRCLKKDEIKEGSTLHWLDSIVGMGHKPDNIIEVDYSEDIGVFFKNALLYICKLNEHLKKLFGEKISLDITKIKKLEYFK